MSSNIINFFTNTAPLVGFGIAGYFSALIGTRVKLENIKQKAKTNAINIRTKANLEKVNRLEEDVKEMKVDIKEIKMDIGKINERIAGLEIRMDNLEENFRTETANINKKLDLLINKSLK